MKNEYPKRGDVYWVRLDPSSGKEINKTRPCLVISSDIANRSELIVVAPITSNVERLFSKIEVKIMLKNKQGKILLRQLRCIDQSQRLGSKIGSITAEEMKSVDDALRLILAL